MIDETNFMIETHRNNKGIYYMKIINKETGKFIDQEIKEGDSIIKLKKLWMEKINEKI